MSNRERPPPHDLDAEAAVLSACILTRTVSEVLPILRTDDFYSGANQKVWRALVSLEADGGTIDLLTIKRWLDDHCLLDDICNSSYLVQLIDATPAVANVVAHAEIVASKAQVRRVIDAAHQIAAEGYVVNGQSGAYLANALKALQNAVKESSVKRVFDCQLSEEIMDTLPPILWVCAELCIGPGRPTLIQGYGFSGKTIAAQAMALAIAAGVPIWGYFRCRPGLVLHIDYEQGKHATCRRYQRLAFAMGLSVDDMQNNLRLSCFPRAYLTDQGIEDVLNRECKDATVCIIDSFRAAIPGQDENESTVRQFLDMLTRVSDVTGCAFVVIHHAGKGSKDKDSREKGRGSGAIFDACGTVIDLQAKEPYEPVKVTFAKASASSEGRAPESFYLSFSDIADDEARDMKAGLLVEHKTAEQVDQPESPRATWLKDVEDVHAALRKAPGSSGSAIARMSRKSKGVALDALKDLERQGRARQDKAGGKKGGGGLAWWPATCSETPKNQGGSSGGFGNDDA